MPQTNIKKELMLKLNNFLKYFFPLVLIWMSVMISKSINLVLIIHNILSLVAPLIIAIIIAWMLYPLKERLKKKGMSNVIASLIVFFSFLFIIIGSILIVSPYFYKEIHEFISSLPKVIFDIEKYITNLAKRIDLSNLGINSVSVDYFINQQLENYQTIISDNLTGIMSTSFGWISSISSMILNIFFVGSMSVYLLVDFNKLTSNIKYIFRPSSREDGVVLLQKINKVSFGYVRGTIIISFIVTIVTTILLMIIKAPVPLLFGLLCGVLNVIPYIGPFLGGIPTVIVALTASPVIGIMAGIGILVIQQIDGNILKPLLLGKSTNLHPVLIMFGLIVGGALWGIPGMFIITPIVAMIKTIYFHYDDKYDFFKRNTL